MVECKIKVKTPDGSVFSYSEVYPHVVDAVVDAQAKYPWAIVKVEAKKVWAQ